MYLILLYRSIYIVHLIDLTEQNTQAALLIEHPDEMRNEGGEFQASSINTPASHSTLAWTVTQW